MDKERITISLDVEIYRALDKLVAINGLTRSAYIELLIRCELQKIAEAKPSAEVEAPIKDFVKTPC